MSQEPKRPKKRLAKQIKGEWPDDRIRRLIAAVKLRPKLYNIAIRPFGSEKDKLWKEVGAELGNADDWLDCRAKWQGLRVTFKVNLATLRRHPFGSNRIHWRFFEAMRFVDSSEGQKFTEATSNSDVNGDDKLIATTTPTCSTNSAQRRKRAVKEVPLDRQALKNAELKKMQELALQLYTQRDAYSIFGEYIANELRGLPLDESCQLRRRINQTLVAFFEEREVKQEQYRVADENCCPINDPQVIWEKIPLLQKAKFDGAKSHCNLAGFIQKEDTLCTDPEDNATHHSDIDACEIKLEDTETEEPNENESISPTPEANSASTISSDLLSFTPDVPPASEWDLPSNFIDDSAKPACLTTTTAQYNHSTDEKADSTKRAYPFAVLEQSVAKLQKTIEQHKQEVIDDEFDLFGKSIALQLKRMPLERALICQENLQKVMIQERLLQR